VPSYPGPNQATLLLNNRQGYLWQNETPPAGTQPSATTSGSLSASFELQRINQSFYPWGLSFELTFSGAPGDFEVDLLAANNDVPTSYVVFASITQAATAGVATGSYTYRYDMASNVWPKYVAAYLKTLNNSVSVTLQVTK
jgi:hypothetical protein